jgi:CRP-like cAMP-binding protein
VERQRSRSSTPHKKLDFVAPAGERRESKKRSAVFSQGDPADSVFYILNGKVKLTVVSKQGKEAIVALLNRGSFFGEGCLAGQPRRVASATAVSDCLLLSVGKQAIMRLLQEQPEFSALFVSFLLARPQCRASRLVMAARAGYPHPETPVCQFQVAGQNAQRPQPG